MGRVKIIFCEQCGVEAPAKRDNQRFCSVACRVRAHLDRRIERDVKAVLRELEERRKKPTEEAKP